MIDITKDIQDVIYDIKKQGYNSICFWLPARNVGGGNYYFCLLAQYLTENSDFKIYYVDFSDGYSHEVLKHNNKITFLDYNEKMTVFPVKEPMIIFTNTTRAVQIMNMNPRNKLLFWHYETLPCNWDILFLNGEKKQYIKLLKQNNAIIYLDRSGRDILNKQFPTLNLMNKDYLQVYVKPKDIESSPVIINENEINIAWVGRLGHDKIYAIFNIIDCLAKYETNKKKRIYIIGDGPKRKDVEKYCIKYNKEIEFILTGTIPNYELHEYLKNKVDMLFSMGMTTLEGACIKMPTAVVLLSTKHLRNNEFYWIYDTKEYCVGITPDQKTDFNIHHETFPEMLDKVYVQNLKGQQGRKCYEYYINNHADFDDIALKFLIYLHNTSLTFSKLKNCLRYVPYTQVSMICIKVLGLPFWTIVKFGENIKEYLLFKILVMRVVSLNNKKWYKPFGFKALFCKYSTKCWTFPNSQFKDK